MVLGNVFGFFSSAPDPGANVAEITICPHAEFAALPCETPHNDTCQTVVQPDGYADCIGKQSKKYRAKKKSKLDRLIDQEFDELYKNLKQLNEDNDCLQLKKCKNQKFKNQDDKVLPNGCRDYGAFVANNECKNMFDKHKTNQVNFCQQKKEKKSNFGQCLSAFEKIRNRFAKDMGKINKELDFDVKAAATQYLCKKTRFEKVKENCTNDYNEINGVEDCADSIMKNHECSSSPKQNKSKKKGKFRKKGQQRYYTISKSTNSSNEMSKNSEEMCKNSGENVNDKNRNENDDNELDEYSKIEHILGQNKKFVLKECEFIFKSPVNKDYLIKIRELEEANERNKSEGAKHKLMNFICGKNDKTQQPTTSKGKEKSCEEKFTRKKIFDIKGKANGGAKDEKKKSMSLGNRNQGTKEKETMRDKIKYLLSEGRPHCVNKSKCETCRTKHEDLCNLPFEDRPQTQTGNENNCKPCSRNDQRQTLQNDQRPETIKHMKDMNTICCSCKNNNNDNKETNTDEDEEETNTYPQTEDEFIFLNELCSESFADHSDTLENKIKKKKFFEAFLHFLEDNKEEIRKQYLEYKTNCSVGGESGDSNYVCWHGHETHPC